MSNSKLLYKCEWVNTDIATLRIYVSSNGKFTCKRENKPTISMSKEGALGEIASAVNSQYGYTKKFFLNTDLFREIFKNESVVDILIDTEKIRLPTKPSKRKSSSR